MLKLTSHVPLWARSMQMDTTQIMVIQHAVRRAIRILDIRAATACMSLADAHSAAINRIQWHPSNSHLLLSCAMDPFIHLFDIRHAERPLHSYSGHAPGRQALT